MTPARSSRRPTSSRDYASGGGTVHALRGVDLSSRAGSCSRSAAARGPARRRSSTCSAGSTGRRPAASSSTGTWSDARRRELASPARHRGFVFQAFGLVPILSAAENVEVPLRLRPGRPATRDARVTRCWTASASAERAHHRPPRAVRRRAAARRDRPRAGQQAGLLLADEPTGQLDSNRRRW